MIKLKNLLTEDELSDLKKKALEVLRLVKSKAESKAPRGFGGFQVAWSYYPQSNKKEIIILYDTPREVRHPEEYHIDRKKMKAWENFEDYLDMKVLQELDKKYPDIEIDIAGDIHGQPGGKTGSPRMSSF
jgi:hypothetical protein